jgi:hypothetical protein
MAPIDRIGRISEIARQMRAEASDPRELDEYAVARIAVIADPETPHRSEAERMAEIRAVLAAYAVVRPGLTA